ncbi:MAG: Gfo/Idh/MocA family oxidoreductase [Planctomycetota bacterium]|nr:Gfo/Idh/MocA family oxidoreductase [Planctomycetota bacterium]
MPEKLRVGILGLSHDHVWSNVQTLIARDDALVVGAADSHAELCRKFNSEFEVDAHADAATLLDEGNLDAVYVFSSNAEGASLAVAAADRGLHILIEKPMAASLAQADAMLAAARRNNVRLMVNWPFAWWPQLQQALRLAEAGAIGNLWQVKYRAAHAGPQELGCSPAFCDWLFDPKQNGGGALMDYCCYGAVLARVAMGVPSRVTALTGRFCKENITVEDNALLAMTYPRGMATAEGSWTQIGKLTSYTTALYGDAGTLLVEPRDGGRLFLATLDDPEGSEVAVPSSEPHLTDSAAHFLCGIRTGTPFQPLCQDRICRDTQEILEAGLLSVAAGSEISLPLVM